MKNPALLLLILASSTLFASDLKISQPILYIENQMAFTVFNIEWNNSWNNNISKDGVWLFFKTVWHGKGFKHIAVAKSGHEAVAHFNEQKPELKFRTSMDGAGLFISTTNSFRGSVEATIKVELLSESFEGINTRNSSFVVYGIEMVEIPAGSFFAGDSNPDAIEHGAIYKPNKKGGFGSLVEVIAEDQQFTVSENGDLYYKANEGYEGDQNGVIPKTYPKGTSRFLIMKYEPTEGQYVNFLNSLGIDQRKDRVMIDLDDYESQGGSISRSDQVFHTPYPDKPCKFMSWEDGAAFADWAGLRPMTELEFTKASRGTDKPIQADFPWGTSSKLEVQRFPNKTGSLAMRNGWDESKLTNETKQYFGASYYWVMDLSGSMWERVITLGHLKGRNFMGSHGDGKLSPEGKATNEDWPTGEEDSGGVGYRGGGFYGYDREYHSYNPFSPISYRPYGSWHGTGRTNSYGARFVRTVDW